jgi:hypothetical protein
VGSRSSKVIERSCDVCGVCTEFNSWRVYYVLGLVFSQILLFSFYLKFSVTLETFFSNRTKLYGMKLIYPAKLKQYNTQFTNCASNVFF